MALCPPTPDRADTLTEEQAELVRTGKVRLLVNTAWLVIAVRVVPRAGDPAGYPVIGRGKGKTARQAVENIR
jgi:hypothetical protein